MVEDDLNQMLSDVQDSLEDICYSEITDLDSAVENGLQSQDFTKLVCFLVRLQGFLLPMTDNWPPTTNQSWAKASSTNEKHWFLFLAVLTIQICLWTICPIGLGYWLIWDHTLYSWQLKLGPINFIIPFHPVLRKLRKEGQVSCHLSFFSSMCIYVCVMLIDDWNWNPLLERYLHCLVWKTKFKILMLEVSVFEVNFYK